MDDSSYSDCSDTYDPSFEKPRRERFTKEEDRRLKRAVGEHGTRDWDIIARSLPKRTGRQCRDRYVSYIQMDTNNEPWTLDEDKMIQNEVEKHGSKWTYISKVMKNRSPTQIKNRWRVLYRAKLRISEPKQYMRKRNLSKFDGHFVGEKDEKKVIKEETPGTDIFEITDSNFEEFLQKLYAQGSFFDEIQFKI